MLKIRYKILGAFTPKKIWDKKIKNLARFRTTSDLTTNIFETDRDI